MSRPEAVEKDWTRRRVIVVGAPSDVPRALHHPAVLANQFEVAAMLAIDIEAAESRSELHAIEAVLTEHRVTTIVVAGPVGRRVMQRIADLAQLHRCELLALMPTEVLADQRPVVVWTGDSPMVRLADPPVPYSAVLVKRAIDVAGAIVGIVITAPLLALLSILIRIDSPGNALFRHERVGLAGRRFACLKLRTMFDGAEAQLRNDPEMYEDYRRNHYKLPDNRDRRVTRVGRILRRTSIDELPQLWNVLVGEMSLVGPRPLVAEEMATFVRDDRALLLSMSPGMTGAWAVSGRHEVGYPQREELELNYVRSWSLLGDVRILAKTLPAIYDWTRPTPRPHSRAH